MSITISDYDERPWQDTDSAALRRGLRWAGANKAFLAGLALLLPMLLIAVLAPTLAPMDPLDQDIINRMQPPALFSAEDSPYLLGSDGFGRDVLSRILFGMRISFSVVFLAIIISGSAGSLLGLVAGHSGGMLETVIMRLVDMQLALPPILLAAAVTTVFSAKLVNLVIVLAISGWVTYARIMYSETLSIKEREYVLAARAAGASDLRIIRKHILPNAIGSLVVVATLQVGSLILFEAALSFLGLGVPPPRPSLGSMMSEGRNVLAVAPWLATFPGLTIVFAVLGINYLGNGLREILDPKL